MLKCLGDTGKQILLELLNKVAKKYEIPLDWKTAIIIPLRKKEDKKNVLSTEVSLC